MKINQLRNLNREEILDKERHLREELSKLNQQRYAGRIDKPHMYSSIRKDIARIQTILNEKKTKTPVA
jgi:large subunit ribosomal protein L29